MGSQDAHPYKAGIRYLDILTWVMSEKAQQGAGLSSPEANPESAPGEAGLALPSAVTAAPPPPRDGIRGGTSSGGPAVMRPPRCAAVTMKTM